jgi:hypothetical protein
MSPERSNRSGDVVFLLDKKRCEQNQRFVGDLADSIVWAVTLEIWKVDPARGLSDMDIDRKSGYDRPWRPFTICISNGDTS